eukprot:3841355-Amphidinium_carterae.3
MEEFFEQPPRRAHHSRSRPGRMILRMILHGQDIGIDLASPIVRRHNDGLLPTYVTNYVCLHFVIQRICNSCGNHIVFGVCSWCLIITQQKAAELGELLAAKHEILVETSGSKGQAISGTRAGTLNSPVYLITLKGYAALSTQHGIPLFASVMRCRWIIGRGDVEGEDNHRKTFGRSMSSVLGRADFDPTISNALQGRQLRRRIQPVPGMDVPEMLKTSSDPYWDEEEEELNRLEQDLQNRRNARAAKRHGVESKRGIYKVLATA